MVVLGKQGAGKGTQCVRLSHRYVVPHISTGDLFRGAVRSRSAFGAKVASYLDAGELVPDELVIDLVGERLGQDDTSRGFVLDGFPRTTHQAEALSGLLRPDDLDVVIDLDVPTTQVLRRLADRRVCSDCGTNFSVRQPPRFNWTCDICGGEVVQREDDTEGAIRRRLDLYERETAPLVAWYRGRQKLVRVYGVGTPDLVTERMVRAIDRRLGRTSSPG